MNSDRNADRSSRVNPRMMSSILHQQGNILVYLVVVLLIFAVLGVSLVSLFTTATGSSATPNDAKRARFIAESGIRYALSEIRNSPDVETAAELLNTTTAFKLGKEGSFTADVFSPGLTSPFAQTTSGGVLFLDVPYGGKFPDDFAVHNAVNDLYIINWRKFPEPTHPDPDKSHALVTGSTDASGATTITVNLNVGDQYDAAVGDTVCFGLLTTEAGTIHRGDSIFVNEKAIEFFPTANGAIRIVTDTPTVTYNYYYEERVHDTTNNRVELTNIREMPGKSWNNIDLEVGDYVILSPYNFRVFASGTSDQTTVEVGKDRPFWALAVPSEYTIYMRELLQDKSLVQEGDVIRTQEAGDKKIELGASGGGSEGFGDLWYSGNKPIGGNTDRCKVGRCIFNEGIRTFFTVRLSGDGEGFTFALLGGGNELDTITPVNSALSAGGDVDASELLGYAGDSRTDSAGTTFVDNYIPTKPPGLLPPKMALEFDTRTSLNEPLQYCAGSDLNENTRNDPMPENNPKDVLQYVFWGNETLAISCRGDGETYDDNRHNAEGEEASANWAFDTGAIVQSRPAFDPIDKTVYFGTDGSATGNFFALKANGALRWYKNSTDKVTSTPVFDTIDTDRFVYFSGDDNNTIYKMKTDPSVITGDLVWDEVVPGSLFTKVGPAVDNTNHNLYIGSTNDNFYVYNSAGTLIGSRDLGENIEAPATVDNTGGSFAQQVYQGTDDDNFGVGQLYRFDSGSATPSIPLWRVTPNNDVQSQPAISADGGVVYAVSDIGTVYAYPASGGDPIWTRDLPSVNYLDPAVWVTGGVDVTVYVPTDDGHLYALNPANGNNLSVDWPVNLGFPIEFSSPAVASDGTVFIGTVGGRVFAVRSNASTKWVFQTGGDVKSSPAVGSDGTVYFGSDDNNFYAVATVATPRNYREDYPDFHQVPETFRSFSFYPINQKAHITDDDLQAGADIDSENDWLNGGSLLLPWAVRIEVEKVAAQTYKLSTWIRQCTIGDCSDIKNTLFQDTERKYDYSPLTYPSSVPPIKRQPLIQTITLTATEDEQFERVLFGFTTAAKSGDSQLITIQDFQLTFIEAAREEGAVLNDPNW